MTRAMNKFFTLVALLLSASAAHAQEVVLSTTVTGNQEQPKVLYIIPWQNAERGDALSGAMDSALDDVFSLVDRNELRREIDAIETLLPETQSPTIVK